jgi:mitochondrial intermembrane space import and assembly protein 40
LLNQKKSVNKIFLFLGKDKIIFLTPEDLSKPSSIVLPEDEEPPGLILPSGEINWNCPCLGGMATGPCGVEFREAFSCFHYRLAFH